MSIDEMPAGPEMDRLIAEKICHITPIRPVHGSCCCCQQCGRFKDECVCRYYSDDLSAAVEAACHGCFMLKLETGNHSEWYAEVIGVEGEEGRAFGETAALALCRALLKAVGP